MTARRFTIIGMGMALLALATAGTYALFNRPIRDGAWPGRPWGRPRRRHAGRADERRTVGHPVRDAVRPTRPRRRTSVTHRDPALERPRRGPHHDGFAATRRRQHVADVHARRRPVGHTATATAATAAHDQPSRLRPSPARLLAPAAQLPSRRRSTRPGAQAGGAPPARPADPNRPPDMPS
ncbi:hypothetical protein ACFQX7_16620 [Luedemannella flava]